MLRDYTSLTGQHDPVLVILAISTCLVTTAASVGLAQRAYGYRTLARWPWIAAAAVVLGGGVWATHFLAMLGFVTHLRVAYDSLGTLLAFIVVVLVSVAGLLLAMNGSIPMRLSGGAIVGLGVAAMHFIGMDAMRLASTFSWDLELVMVAVLLGAGFASPALLVALGAKRTTRAGPIPYTASVRRRLAGAVLLTLAICGLHFTAMAALRIEPLFLPIEDGATFSTERLAIAITGVMLIVLVIAHTAHELRLHDSAQRVRTLWNATLEGICLTSSRGRIVAANAPFAKLVGYDEDELIGREISSLVCQEHRDLARMRMQEGSAAPYQIDLVRKDDIAVPVEVVGRMMDLAGRRIRVTAARDMSERRRAEERIWHLAHHDALTDLPNRTLLRDRLGQEMARAERSGDLVALLTLDLDGFKAVNDRSGHLAGDAILQQVAARLRGAVRSMDTVTRFGGDEFVILLPGLARPDDADLLAQRLIDGFAQPFEVDGAAVLVGASYGVALYPKDGNTLDELIRRADLGLYRAKGARGCPASETRGSVVSDPVRSEL